MEQQPANPIGKYKIICMKKNVVTHNLFSFIGFAAMGGRLAFSQFQQ